MLFAVIIGAVTGEQEFYRPLLIELKATELVLHELQPSVSAKNHPKRD